MQPLTEVDVTAAAKPAAPLPLLSPHGTVTLVGQRTHQHRLRRAGGIQCFPTSRKRGLYWDRGGWRTV